MRFPSALLALFLLLVSTGCKAQGIWVEARVLVPLRVELPTGYEAARSYPLVLLLHGSGGTGEAMITLKQRLGRDRFILAAPQGAYPMGGGFRWFHPSDDRKIWALADPMVVEHLQRVIQTLKQRHRIGGVYLLGHSEGAGVAYLTASKLRAEIRGLLAFGASHPQAFLDAADLAALKGLPHFLAHGREDKLFPYGGIPARLAFWKAAEVPTTFEGYRGGHDLSAAPLAEASAWILSQEQAKASAAP